ncbi:MAG: hypothetical protein ACYDAL_06615 [Candidatus Dormibacteraceae bacterium]
MPASRRRASARVAVALLVTALFSLAASVAAQAAANPVSITVNVGYMGFVKAQQWMPVTIDVTNKSQDVSGTLEVTTGNNTNGPPIGSVIYQAHVSVPSGATKHLKTYLVEDQAPATVSARIVQNGQVLASADAPPGTAATVLIGVLSDQSTALDSFAAVHPGGIAASVAHLSLGDVSDSPILLRAFDFLAIDNFATDSLTSAQRGALTDYVQNGGALLLGTGASWRKTLAGVSSALLPMSVDATTTLNSVSAIDNLSGVEIATGTVNPGSNAWLAEGARPLLAEKLVGAGIVTLATFDWNQAPVAGSTGADTLLREVLVRTLFSPVAAQGMFFSKGGGFGIGGTGSTAERSNAVAQALASLPALDLPSLLVIGILVLAYVLFVGPINYFVLRALNHRALAWVTVPLIVIVASAGAFGAGLFTKGRSVETNQVSIIHLEPGWDHAYVESYMGLVTPTRGDYQVNLTGSKNLVGPIFNSGGVVGPSPDLIRVGVDNNSVVLPNMTAFVLRGFATEAVVDTPKLVATAKFANGKLTGTVRNGTTVAFTDAVVVAGDSYQLLKALAPSASATFEVTPKVLNVTGGPPAISTIYGNYYSGPQFHPPTAADREGQEKSSILSLVAASSFSGFNPAITPMVVAWTRRPYEQISVGGSQPPATALTALALPIAVGEIGAGTVPAGMIVSRYTDMEGDSQPGPPGAVTTSNGTVTYDFAPAIVPGLHLTKAVLDSSTQNLYGGPPGTTQGTPQVSVWDWSKSAWVTLSYTQQGTTALPDAAVNPASSEVRLQIAANGSTSNLGPISLTGTVK